LPVHGSNTLALSLTLSLRSFSLFPLSLFPPPLCMSLQTGAAAVLGAPARRRAGGGGGPAERGGRSHRAHPSHGAGRLRCGGTRSSRCRRSSSSMISPTCPQLAGASIILAACVLSACLLAARPHLRLCLLCNVVQGGVSVPYSVGVMVQTPRACLLLDRVARNPAISAVSQSFCLSVPLFIIHSLSHTLSFRAHTYLVWLPGHV
jgi:hypothetical protein